MMKAHYGYTSHTVFSKVTRSSLTYVIVLVLCFLFLIPVFGSLMTAFRLNSDIVRNGFWVFPFTPTLENFKTIFSQGKITVYMRNTMIVTGSATVISVFLGCLTGYAFAKLRFRGKRFLYFLVIAGMFFPPQIVLIPLFKFFNALHMLDTLFSVIVVHVGFGLPICTLIMSNFFRDVPDELRQSAMIDGCSDWGILFRIMMPLAKPSITALIILQFTWIWNDFLWPLVLIKSQNKLTVQMGILQIRGQYGLAWGSQASACLIATIPTLLIFIFLQKYFIRGLTAGAVKE